MLHILRIGVKEVNGNFSALQCIHFVLQITYKEIQGGLEGEAL